MKKLLALLAGLQLMTSHQHECSTDYENDRSAARVAQPEHTTSCSKGNSNSNFLISKLRFKLPYDFVSFWLNFHHQKGLDICLVNRDIK